MKRSAGILLCGALLLRASQAFAQDVAGDDFADAKDDAKRHVASGFVCPRVIDGFERDAVGQRDPETGEDFCSYSALDSVYGTITVTPLQGAYDAKAALAEDFTRQENVGAKKIDERTVTLNGKPPLLVYTRTYETTELAELHYRILFAGAALGNWAVEATIEYADPRDKKIEADFLNSVYAGARAMHSAAPPVVAAKP